MTEHQCVDLEGELVRVQIGAESALGDGGAGHGGEQFEPIAFGLHQRVAQFAGTVVQLD